MTIVATNVNRLDIQEAMKKPGEKLLEVFGKTSGYGIVIAILTFFILSCEKQPTQPTEVVRDTVIHIVPHDIPESDNYTVWVNDSMVFTGQAGNTRHGLYSFSTFDFHGKVNIKVHSDIIIQSLDILPSIKRIAYTQPNENTVEFSLQDPGMITLKINESRHHALHLLTSSPETEKPDPLDPDVHYYEGPKTYDVGVLELHDDQTLYIDAGAVLKGMVLVKDAKNVKIRGRGMIDGSLNDVEGNYPKGEAPWRLIYMLRSEDIEIEGITLFNSLRWTIHSYSCRGMDIDNIRILNWNLGSDGTDISSSQNVSISNSFYRTNDDCIVIKATSFAENAFFPNAPVENMNVKNIHIEGNTLWNINWGNVFEIGYELRCDTVSNITYKDCDVLMQGSRGAVFSIHNTDRAIVDGVLYENIRVEQADHGAMGMKLFNMAIFYSLFSYDSYWGDAFNGHWDNMLEPWPPRGTSQFRGEIKNITYRNIRFIDEEYPYSIFHGFDLDKNIENIVFENVLLSGNKIKGSVDLKLEVNEFVKNIQFY